MKNLRIIILSFLILAIIFNIYITGYANQSEYLRIGLVSHASEQASININANSLEIGRFDGSNFIVAGLIHASNGFIAIPNSNSFYKLQYNFNDFQTALNRANNIPNSFPVLLENGFWGIYSTMNHPGSVIVPQNNNQVALKSSNQIVLVSENGNQNLQFRAAGGHTPVNNRRYRGIIEVARFAGRNITAVNIIHIEQYLYSVVPSEMPALWHMEALKAQAVAARTYAMNRRGQFSAQGFDLVDTIFSQVYLGVDNEHQRSTQAVRETRGIMIFYNNQPIEAVYFSSSGGFTENSENVWQSPRPYLRAVSSRYEPTGMEWSRTISLTQLNSLLNSSNINIGTAQGISISISRNRRVQELNIIGSNGIHSLQREAIRNFFSSLPGGSLQSRNFVILNSNVYNQVTDFDLNSHIESNNLFIINSEYTFQISQNEINLPENPLAITSSGKFAISPQISSPILNNRLISTDIVQTMSSVGNEIILEGRGWGHGVGMSQHGANSMAQIGYSFREILQWYYTGVTIR